VDVPQVESSLVLLRVGVTVEVAQAAVGSLLVAVVRDRADLEREGRVRAGLALVVAGLDEVEDVVVGPVAGAAQGGGLGGPGGAAVVAGPLAAHLELARARVDAPQGTGEVERLAARLHAAVVEDAVEAVESAVRTPGERVGQLVRVGAAEAGDHHFPADRFP